MPGQLINIEIDDSEFKNQLSFLQKRMRNLKPAFKNIGEYMAKERERWFRQERDPEGRPWQKLKVRTYFSLFKKKRRYTKKGKLTKGFLRFLSGRKILTKDHHLRRTVYKAEADKVIISPDMQSQDYAAIHQFGGRAGKNRTAKIPARPHLGVSHENRTEIIEIIREHLLKGMKS